jgi:hypothetical protein
MSASACSVLASAPEACKTYLRLIAVHCRPIPVPTLDEFVLLHKLLQSATQTDPSILGLLRGARRSFGWNVLGEDCADLPKPVPPQTCMHVPRAHFVQHRLVMAMVPLLINSD